MQNNDPGAEPVKTYYGGNSSEFYLPNPDEIRRVCLEIQAGWSDEEWARRTRGMGRTELDPNRVFRTPPGYDPGGE